MPPLAYETAHSLVPTRPFVPSRRFVDRAACLRRLHVIPACPARVAAAPPEPEPVPEPASAPLDPAPVSQITAAAVIRATALHHGVTPGFVTRRSRKRCHVEPRQLAMYLACRLTLQSLPEIGRRFGGFDHTTVMHARNQIDARIAAGDPATLAAVEAIKAALGVG